tara:strand:+ start:281 stop:808 length:528 start_codon:yes stop_codon:yes gene_type:complete
MNAPPPQQQKSSPILKIACFGCIAIILLGVLGCVGITVGVVSMIKGSQPYKDGLAKATADKRVGEALGEPVKAQWLAGGQFNDAGNTGNAELVVPLEGPKGEGVLNISATKSGGKWTVNRATVLIPATGKTIDVVQGADGDEDAKTDEAEDDKTEPAEEAPADDSPDEEAPDEGE